MTSLILSPNVARPDDLYDGLVAMHQGLDDRRSAVVSSKLILLLANHIGDPDVVAEAIALATCSPGAPR